MKAQVTAFSGMEGKKRRPNPADGSVTVCELGLRIERQPAQRDTWKGRHRLPAELVQPAKWQPRQAATVYLDEAQRAELAAALLESLPADLARDVTARFAAGTEDK